MRYFVKIDKNRLSKHTRSPILGDFEKQLVFRYHCAGEIRVGVVVVGYLEKPPVLDFDYEKQEQMETLCVN